MPLDPLNPAALFMIAIGLMALFYAYRLAPVIRWANNPVKPIVTEVHTDPDTLPQPQGTSRPTHDYLIEQGFVLFMHELNEHRGFFNADHWYYHEPDAPEILIEFMVPRKGQINQVFAISAFPDGACIQTQYPHASQTLRLPDLILTYAAHSATHMLDAHRAHLEEWRAQRGAPLTLRTMEDVRAFEDLYWERHTPIIGKSQAASHQMTFNQMIWAGIGMIFTGVLVMVPGLQISILVILPFLLIGLWGYQRMVTRRLILTYGKSEPIDQPVKRIEGVHPLYRNQL